MKYLTDLEADMENPSSLIALAVVKSPAMGVMTKDDFINGWLEAG